MPLGLKRYQTEGHLHFLTFSCHRREPHLTRHYTLFEQSLEQTRKRYNLEVHGYVLMPEHVHLLLSEPATEPLAKALQSLKLSVSKQADTKPLWQPRYYDFNVFTGKKRLEKLHYMHRNPVTRGLVENPEDWPSLQCAPLPHRRTPPHHPSHLPHTLNRATTPGAPYEQLHRA